MPTGVYKRTEYHKEIIRKNHADVSGENNPMFGKGHLVMGKNNSFYGKKHSTKTKKKMSKMMSGEKSPKWKGNDIKYRGKHERIVKLKGKASEHLCIDCEQQAYHWSNIDHKYSSNPDDYLPRCVSCHRIYDYQFNLKGNAQKS